VHHDGALTPISYCLRLLPSVSLAATNSLAPRQAGLFSLRLKSRAPASVKSSRVRVIDGMRPRKSGSQQTLYWRRQDSNPRSPERQARLKPAR
jgi:hypothetical protein